MEKEVTMSKKLFVGSLSWGLNDDSLRDAFSVHGEINEAVVITDRDTGRSRGFGFVTFEDDEAADKAVEISLREPERRVKLWENTRYLRAGLQKLGLHTGTPGIVEQLPQTAILACRIELHTFDPLRAMFQRGSDRMDSDDGSQRHPSVLAGAT